MTSNVNSVDSDDDALMWANQDGNQDDGDAQTDNDQSQRKFVWQWRENDGSWHDYDGGSQALLEQMQIGAHIQITAGKWTYDIVKNAADQCTQTNTSTNASRACRRYQQSDVAPSSKSDNLPQGACNDRYLMMWQFLENDN
eukprot:CAMPEP_0202690254 /NCGR_PEP_ID=MMETSP1385-20130828/5294_1 /ASSEMBLY_ACC=CAM_ASM_000861 /TAXON_ID=933848 /ORGANISM="Elphidium margaritaceum" /LENGTH=140 /DNA_ID=CAMNT_0049345491 /DNA_START=49 /DNA_END=468 /DNA_ORIENTATION=+